MRVSRNTKTQAKLIEELLDISRLTSGKLELNYVQLDFNAFISEIADEQKLSVESKQIDLQVKTQTSGFRSPAHKN